MPHDSFCMCVWVCVFYEIRAGSLLKLSSGTAAFYNIYIQVFYIDDRAKCGTRGDYSAPEKRPVRTEGKTEPYIVINPVARNVVGDFLQHAFPRDGSRGV